MFLRVICIRYSGIVPKLGLGIPKQIYSGCLVQIMMFPAAKPRVHQWLSPSCGGREIDRRERVRSEG